MSVGTCAKINNSYQTFRGNNDTSQIGNKILIKQIRVLIEKIEQHIQLVKTYGKCEHSHEKSLRKQINVVFLWTRHLGLECEMQEFGRECKSI
jgi:hypothetical protein